MSHSLLEPGCLARIEKRLGGKAALTASAREHKALRRCRGVTDATALLRLALMYGPGECSLRMISALNAADETTPSLSDVALLNRLRGAADWLEALCRGYLATLATSLDTDTPEAALRIVDASRIEGPGPCVWRLHLCYAPTQGRIADALFTPLGQGERLDRLAVQSGEIRIGDRGYPQPDGLRAVREAGADVLVRLTWNSLRLLDRKGRPLDWTRMFEQAETNGTLERAVQVVKARGAYEPLPMRLLLIRKPPAGAAKARVKARRASRKDQRRKTDPRTLAAAGFVILLTSLPVDRYPLSKVGSLYRLRWQVEQAFKRMKSVLHIDRLRAKDSALVRAWLYAHLLFALVIDDAVSTLDPIPP